MQTLFAAFKNLTAWGVVNASPIQMSGRSAIYFPLVGLCLGLLLALSNYLLTPHVHPEILNLVLIALLIFATGAQNIHGLKQSFDALETTSLISEGNTTGTLGVAAIVLVILGKFAATNSMDERATLSFLLAPALARWGLMVFFYGRDAAFDEKPRSSTQRVGFLPLLANTAAILLLVIYLLGRRGLWVALWISLFTLSLRGLLYRRHGTLSHAAAGASVELNETLSLILLASL